jgi:NADP-dependent 3-hydroxy acid dehydrogenase YdfG
MSRFSAAPRVVAITGGARGIGLATARAFADAGARVAIGDLDLDRAETAATSLPTPCIALPLDVADPRSFAAFLDGAESALGPIDVLVNNAGVMLTGDFLAESRAVEQRMLDVNLGGVITGSRLAAERFVVRGSGHIVNVASMAGVAGFPGVATYCATKFGIVGFTAALREELWPTGVRVSAVLPGIVHTELSAGLRISPLIERFSAVEPEDIATAVQRSVARNAPMTYAPARLGVMMRASLALPEGVRRRFQSLFGVGRLYLNVDQPTRDAYHERVMHEEESV